MNIAARLQAEAAPDTVVISAAALRLVKGLFVVEELGPRRLKGIAQPIDAFRVVRLSGVRSRLDVGEDRLTPFVGRDLEVGVLLERWERVQEGDGQVVVISGEPGVGKSRLVHALRKRIAEQRHTWLECRCTPYTRQSAFHPLIELLGSGLEFGTHDEPGERRAKLVRDLETFELATRERVALLAALLGISSEHDDALAGMSADLQRRKTMQAVVAWCLAIAASQPLLLLVEDLHWCDPSSLELLGKLVDQCPGTTTMVVCTARPEFAAPWPQRAHVTPLHLSGLARRHVHEMVAAVGAGCVLPGEVRDTIVARADGVPLYVEELTRSVIESGVMIERDGRYELTKPLGDIAIPATLEDSLRARLDRVGPAKEVAQRAAVLGREFSDALLAATAGLPREVLDDGLARLVAADLMFVRGEPPDATYVFKHALVQNVAYGSLLKRTRQELHGRAATAIDAQFPSGTAAPEVIARHYEAAGLEWAAAHRYRQAAAQAAERSAHVEAIAHLRRAIALLAALPEGAERNRLEIDVQLALSASTLAVRGHAHPETEAAYDRIRMLSERSGDIARLAPALAGMSNVHLGHCRWELALAEQLLAIGAEPACDLYEVFGHTQIGTIDVYRGKFASSISHMELAVSRYDPARHNSGSWGEDLRVSAHVFGSGALWIAGFPARALAEACTGLEWARRVVTPFDVALAHLGQGIVHWLRGDRVRQRASAEEAIALSEAQGFPLWLGASRALRAAAVGDSASVEEAIAGLAAIAETHNQAGAPQIMGMLIEAQWAAGQHAEALAIVDAALALSAETHQPFWDAELLRLRGELLLATGSTSSADVEPIFAHAVEIAHGLEAHSLELRAATSLARLRQRDGKIIEAQACLAPVYAWFTEGFDTHDLIAANALLAELDAAR